MNNFIKQTFASLIGSLAAILIIFALGTSGLVLLIVSGALKDNIPNVKDKSVLVFNLAIQITDNQSPSEVTEIIEQKTIPSINLRQVINSIEAATKDEKITALFLDGSSGISPNGYANLTEIRTALEKFKASGKKIIAYGIDWPEQGYYLASMADKVIIHPMGAIEINGLSSQQLFFSGALEKYGIDAQVVRVGKYKSAVEPFTRENFSPESRQQTQALLDDIWQEFLTTVTKDRQLKSEALQLIANNQGLLTPEAAKKQGLVDQIAYFDEVVEEFKQLTNSSDNSEKEDQQSFPKISLGNYQAVAAKAQKTSQQKIAIVYAEGEIVDGEGNTQQVGGARFAKEFRKIREDEDIKAVILRVNSPGGSATASEIIAREIKLTVSEKPVIISMGNVAASGGYWISTEGERIFAQESTITGSIGVFGVLFSFEKIANNNGITVDSVKTGSLADINNTLRPKTPEELKIYQQYVDQIYNTFLDKVSQSRKLPKAKVAEIAQGRVWSGQDAVKIGLVDDIGGLETAIAYAAKKANLGDDWEIEEFPRALTWTEEIFGKIVESKVNTTQKSDPLTLAFRKLQQETNIIQSFNDPKGIYARLFFNLTID